MSKELGALKPKEVIKALEKAGFIVKRITGSHYILVNEKIQKAIPVHITLAISKQGLCMVSSSVPD